MDLDEIEDLIRRYLSAGIAVVLILIAPAGAGEEPTPRDDPAVVTVTPAPDGPAGPAPEDADGEDAPDPGTTTPDRPDWPDTGDGDARGPADTAEPGVDEDPDVPADDTDTDTGDADTDTGDGAADTGDGAAAAEEPDPADGTPADDDSTTDDTAADDRTTDDDTDTTAPTGRDAPATTTPRSTTGTAPSAAGALGWGTPDREDDFASGLSQWVLYEGPGHAGRGMRAPEAATVRDGTLTITGDAAGTTAGMCWAQGRRYGRWEGRVRAPESDPSYDALMLLWPDADDFPVGGEIDFMEMQDPARQRTGFFLHHGTGDEQVTGQVEVDATQWHNWAVEWTPDAITAFVDGEQWFRTTDTATFPPGPMHLCIQLDWFPDGPGPVQESSLEVDWVRQYGLTGS